jgi:hypothetical protein
MSITALLLSLRQAGKGPYTPEITMPVWVNNYVHVWDTVYVGVDHIHVTQYRVNMKEPLGPITGREFLDQLCGCQLLNDWAIRRQS